MNRRTFAGLLPAAGLAWQAARAIPEPHFPSRIHQFVWRTWELANTDRIAAVLNAAERDVLAVGASMGLPRKRRLSPDQLRRIYITVIRQNWHLLPDDQMVALLGWTRDKYAFTLKEDDFLDVKLGPKPVCEPVVWRAFTKQEREAANRMREIVRETMGKLIDEPGEDLCAFLKQPMPPPRATSKKREARWSPRILYSYFALYGDPLLEPDADPFPEAYLAQLAEVGISGVWMQAVLNTLAPSKAFPEFGVGSETRLRNLRLFSDRLAKHGLKLYLYLNEPRAMPDAFFQKYPQTRGAKFQNLWSMCTSAPVVREWITDSLEHVMRAAPDLGGFLSITMSENHTNCFSHGGAWGTGAPKVSDCPRCSKRTGWETIAELITTYRDGVRRVSKTADIISWDWGWGDELARNLIPLLPRDTVFQSISEWDTPVNRGGVQTKVGEYSISAVGPGPRATRNWKIARDAGLRTMAKTQFNNTWELSAVPYIPVPHLVAEHASHLAEAGVSGIMASWTCGGYPSPNLEAASAYYYGDRPRPADVVRNVAESRYGAKAAPQVTEAWRLFSEAFRQFPYGVAIYTVPVQHGPANLLRNEPTGVRPSMILFPQDGLKAWSGAYPPAVAQSQFAKVADGWQRGLDVLRSANVPALDLAIAETCYLHFRSVANQMAFYLARDRGDRAEMKRLGAAEIEIAKRQYVLARRHSLIGFEATNHYYYTPLDLVEKILNCRQIGAS